MATSSTQISDRPTSHCTTVAHNTGRPFRSGSHATRKLFPAPSYRGPSFCRWVPLTRRLICPLPAQLGTGRALRRNTGAHGPHVFATQTARERRLIFRPLLRLDAISLHPQRGGSEKATVLPLTNARSRTADSLTRFESCFGVISRLCGAHGQTIFSPRHDCRFCVSILRRPETVHFTCWICRPSTISIGLLALYKEISKGVWKRFYEIPQRFLRPIMFSCAD
jgi:hypothetical protein